MPAICDEPVSSENYHIQEPRLTGPCRCILMNVFFFFSKHLNWKKNVSQVINMNLSHGQKEFILPTLVTNQNTEFASSCQALYFLPLITSCMDRTLTNGMLVKFLARIAMNGAPTLSNILPLRSESFLFFLSCLNFVIPVRF